MYIFIVYFVYLSSLLHCGQAATVINSCSTITNSGNYIIDSNIQATSNPCFLIKGNYIELNGNGHKITDNTGGSKVGIQVEGTGHYLHDIALENFAIGVDLYSSNTLVENVAPFGTIAGNATGMRCTGCFAVDIENIMSSFDLTSTTGTVVGLQFNRCDGIYVTDVVATTQSKLETIGIQVTDSVDGVFSNFELKGRCNSVGVDLTQSSNIRFYSGNNYVYGCDTDVLPSIGMSINSCADVMISDVTCTTTKSRMEAKGINAVSSSYIGLTQSTIIIESNQESEPAVSLYLLDSIGFTMESSTLQSNNLGNSTGLYLAGRSQLGTHFSQIQGFTTAAYVSSTSTFYTNSLGSSRATIYSFQDSNQCLNSALNVNPTNACFPPSEDSCCSSGCSVPSTSTCQPPTITSVLGVPFPPSGAYITILGSNFGNGYFDTVVQFNDTLCLIHEKTDSTIVCWISGEDLDDAHMSLVSRSSTVETRVALNASCAVNTDCTSNICYEGQCIISTNQTLVAGQGFNISIDLGNGNSVVISSPPDAFPPGYIVQSLSRSVSGFYKKVDGYIRILDFEFYVINTAGETVSMYWSPVLFAFKGPDVRASENLYVGVGDAFNVEGSAVMDSSWTALYNVTHGGNGVFALMAPAPTISNVTQAPTSGGHIIISGSNFGTSGVYMIVDVATPSQGSIFCPVHVANALVTENSIRCLLPAGVGQNLTLTINTYFPASTVTVSTKYSYQAPTISVINPNRTILQSELPGLIITVIGSNFGPNDSNNSSRAPVFTPLVGSQTCTSIQFLEPHQKFTCQLGSYANTSLFQLVVGDVGLGYSQLATFNLSIALVTPPVGTLTVAAPVRVCAGAFFAVNVSAFDSNGLLVSGNLRIDIGFSSTDPNSTLPSSGTLVSGLQSFSGFMFPRSGQYILSVSSNETIPSSTTVTVLEAAQCILDCDGGDNSTCCNTTIDACGVCNGNGSTCAGVTKKSDDKHIGAIVGGTVGGFFGLLLVVALVAFFVNRRLANRPPPSFTITETHPPGSNVKFGISELGTGYSPNINKPNVATNIPPASGPPQM